MVVKTICLTIWPAARKVLASNHFLLQPFCWWLLPDSIAVSLFGNMIGIDEKKLFTKESAFNNMVSSTQSSCEKYFLLQPFCKWLFLPSQQFLILKKIWTILWLESHSPTATDGGKTICRPLYRSWHENFFLVIRIINHHHPHDFNCNHPGQYHQHHCQHHNLGGYFEVSMQTSFKSILAPPPLTSCSWFPS